MNSQSQFTQNLNPVQQIRIKLSLNIQQLNGCNRNERVYIDIAHVSIQIHLRINYYPIPIRRSALDIGGIAHMGYPIRALFPPMVPQGWSTVAGSPRKEGEQMVYTLIICM